MKRRQLKSIFFITFVAVLALLTVSAQGQQPAQAYRWATVAPSALLGDQAIPAEVAIDGIVFADNGAFATVVRWVTAGTSHVELITQNSATNVGDILDRQRIVDILGGSLSVNRSGTVAYEAVYSDPSAGGTTSTGIFANGRFLQRLDAPTGSTADFTLTDDGRILLAPATAGAVSSRTSPSPAAGADAQKAATSDSAGYTVPPSVEKEIRKRLPAWTKDIPIPGTTAQKPGSSPKGGEVTAKPLIVPPAVAPQPVRAVPCALPPFPIPPEWQIGAGVSGSIASHVFDASVGNRQYYSSVLGLMAAPMRIVHFAGSCQSALITIVDPMQRGRFELWTPAGMATWTRPDGSLELNGIAERATPVNLIRLDPPVRTNGRGQILMPVNTPAGFALLLGTPAGGVR